MQALQGDCRQHRQCSSEDTGGKGELPIRQTEGPTRILPLQPASVTRGHGRYAMAGRKWQGRGEERAWLHHTVSTVSTGQYYLSTIVAECRPLSTSTGLPHLLTHLLNNLTTHPPVDQPSLPRYVENTQ